MNRNATYHALLCNVFLNFCLSYTYFVVYCICFKTQNTVKVYAQQRLIYASPEALV